MCRVVGCMSNKGATGIAVGIFKEPWPGYIPVDSGILSWAKLSSIKIEIVDDTSVDPTEESNAVSWGNN